MGKWLRADAIRKQHHKFVSGGFWCGVAVDAAWDIAKAFDAPCGDITGYWTAEYVSRWVNLEPQDIDRLQLGMKSAERVRLIERVDGRVLVHDWDEHQPAGDSTDRVRKHRAKRVTPVSDVTCNVTCNTSVTETTHGTDGTDGTDGTGHDNETPAPVSPIAQDAEQMNRNRRSGVAGAPTKYKQAVDCIDCSKPMVLRRNSRDGTLFYSHPRGTALGCTQTYEAEFYEQARVEAAELRHGASQPSKPRPGWCQRCGKVRSGTAELCACCQQDDLARKLTGGDADA